MIDINNNKKYKETISKLKNVLNIDLSEYKNNKYLSFDVAKKVVGYLNFKRKKDWNLFCQNELNINLKIPKYPNIVYKNEWINWKDWFGIKYYITMSRPEKIINDFLSRNEIPFVPQKCFNDNNFIFTFYIF